MIKANELRVGNYVNYKPIDDICDLSLQNRSVFNMIDVDDIHLISTGTMNDRFEPIQLTEHWLIIFGFEKVVYDDDQHGYGTEYHLKVNSDIFLNYDEDFSVGIFGSKELMKDEIGVIPNWRTIKTVHGLQNLYFALTGEELEIKK